MKKILLPFFACVAVAASAQSYETGLIMNDDVDYTTDGTDGVLATFPGTDNVTVEMLTADKVKQVTTHVPPYRYYILGGDAENKIGDMGDSSNGVQGNSNPTACDGGAVNEAGSYLVFSQVGFQLAFNVAKDGYLYVFNKMTTSKNYYVAEYTTGLDITSASAVAYSVGMVTVDVASDPFGATDGVITYDLEPRNDQGYYTGAYRPATPEQIYFGSTIEEGATAWTTTDEYTAAVEAYAAINSGKTSIGASGFGVIRFPVYEGMTYAVFASGSKISYSGFAFSEECLKVEAYAPADETEGTAESTVTLLEAVEGSGSSEEGNAVRVITVDNSAIDADAPVYNLAGQKVATPVSGQIYIQNGKKFVVK